MGNSNRETFNIDTSSTVKDPAGFGKPEYPGVYKTYVSSVTGSIRNSSENLWLCIRVLLFTISSQTAEYPSEKNKYHGPGVLLFTVSNKL